MGMSGADSRDRAKRACIMPCLASCIAEIIFHVKSKEEQTNGKKNEDHGR